MMLLIETEAFLRFIKEHEDAMGSAAFPIIQKHLNELGLDKTNLGKAEFRVNQIDYDGKHINQLHLQLQERTHWFRDISIKITMLQVDRKENKIDLGSIIIANFKQ